ncbi:hypothetical protein I203_105420 [Kwoniella mangroviensis CBS 8507]|uniref:uncharacterized protein n=1 Tax=Kwoniella mangroviensis CBS 8507 TaxID=1296122 RepID=UPI0030494047
MVLDVLKYLWYNYRFLGCWFPQAEGLPRIRRMKMVVPLRRYHYFGYRYRFVLLDAYFTSKDQIQKVAQGILQQSRSQDHRQWSHPR